MTDIATFGFAIDSSSAKEAAQNLRDMAAASKDSQKGATELLSVSKMLEDSINQMIKRQDELIRLERLHSGELERSAGGWRNTITALSTAASAAANTVTAYGALHNRITSSTPAVDSMTRSVNQLADAHARLSTAQAANAPPVALRGDYGLGGLLWANSTNGFANYIDRNAPGNLGIALARQFIPGYAAIGQLRQWAGPIMDRASYGWNFDTDSYARDVQASATTARDLAFQSGSTPQSAARYGALNQQTGLSAAQSGPIYQHVAQIMACQSAGNLDPRSASNNDPLSGLSR